MVEITFVIPCLNEEVSLPQVLCEIDNVFKDSELTYEVLVADNGSVDDSVSIARSFGARVISVSSLGYGYTLREGISAAKGKFVVMGDADGSYLFEDSIEMIQLLRNGCDVVVGNRFKGGIEPKAMPLLHRFFGNPALTALGKLLFGLRLGDMHCGLRAVNKERVEGLNLVAGGMEFASEMIVAACHQKYQIEEVPVRLRKDLRNRPPHLRTWADGWRHLRFLLAFSSWWLVLAVAVISAISGLTLMVLSIMGSVTIGNITFSYRTAIVSFGVLNISSSALWTFLIARQFLFQRVITNKHVVGTIGLMSLVLCLFGMVLIVKYLQIWGRLGFGGLPIEDGMLGLIGATFCFSTGAVSFFLSLLYRIANTLNSKY